MTKWLIATLILLGSAPPAGAAICLPFEVLAKRLTEGAGESVQAQLGLSTKGYLVELFMNPSSGSFTIVAKHPDGRACILDVGHAHGQPPEAKPPAVGYTPIHDWYRGLQSPRSNNCCNDRDCHEVPLRSTPGEIGHEVYINGAWMPVPPNAIVGMFSPDGNAHACWSGTGRNPYIRCVILPGRGV